MKNRWITTALFAAAAIAPQSGAVWAQHAVAPGSPQQSGQYNASAADEKKTIGPTADAYRPAGKDPFKKEIVRPAGKPVAAPPKLMGFPALDVRRIEFRQKVARARQAGGVEPDPLTQYLVAELEVLGVFSDDRGQGVFLRAQPTGTTFFVRQGAKCYNGEIMRIETDPGDLSGSRVVFKETAFLEANGKRSPTDRLVAKMAVSQSR